MVSNHSASPKVKEVREDLRRNDITAADTVYPCSQEGMLFFFFFFFYAMVGIFGTFSVYRHEVWNSGFVDLISQTSLLFKLGLFTYREVSRQPVALSSLQLLVSCLNFLDWLDVP